MVQPYVIPKLDNLTLIPGTHMTGGNEVCKVLSDFCGCSMACAPQNLH